MSKLQVAEIVQILRYQAHVWEVKYDTSTVTAIIGHEPEVTP